MEAPRDTGPGRLKKIIVRYLWWKGAGELPSPEKDQQRWIAQRPMQPAYCRTAVARRSQPDAGTNLLCHRRRQLIRHLRGHLWYRQVDVMTLRSLQDPETPGTPPGRASLSAGLKLRSPILFGNGVLAHGPGAPQGRSETFVRPDGH